MSVVSRPAPRVRFRSPHGPVRGVVLVLHGGKARSRRSPYRWQLAVARMAPFAAQLARAGRSEGLAVGTVLYRMRGWNGAQAEPVRDVEAILGQVRARYGPVPVVLVGHSMGGRAALRCAGDASVTGVVALAPWLEAAEPLSQLAGKQVLILHGDRDRWTDPRASLRYAHAGQGVARTLGRVQINGEGHTMLRRAPVWHELTLAFVARTLGWRTGSTLAAKELQHVLDHASAGQIGLAV